MDSDHETPVSQPDNLILHNPRYEPSHCTDIDPFQQDSSRPKTEKVLKPQSGRVSKPKQPEPIKTLVQRIKALNDARTADVSASRTVFNPAYPLLFAPLAPTSELWEGRLCRKEDNGYMKFEWPENVNYIKKLSRGLWKTTTYKSSLSFHNLVHGTNSQVTRTKADGDLLALTLPTLDTTSQTVVMSSDSQPLVVVIRQGLFYAWTKQSQKNPDICWETLNIRVAAVLDQLNENDSADELENDKRHEY